MHVPNQWSQWSYIYMYVKSIDFFLFLRFFGFILDLFRQGGILCFSCYQLLKYHPVFIKCMLFYLDIPVYSYFMPVQGTVKTIDPRCWRWLENCCLKSSPAPRDNRFDCSLNRHDITVLLSYIHAHNHKSTEDDNVSIPYHLPSRLPNELNGHWCAWQEWRTAHRSRAWNSSDPEVEEQSTVSLRRLLLLKFSCNQLKI